MSKKKLKDIVLLVAYDSDGEVVEETNLSYFDYYEELHPLIDEDEYRSDFGIRKLARKIYDDDGKLQQEFEVFYTKDGAYQRSRAVHEDGTVTED